MKINNNHKKKRKIVENSIYGAIYLSVGVVLLSLLGVIFWVVANGYNGVSIDFLTSSAITTTHDVTFKDGETYNFDYTYVEPEEETHDEKTHYEIINTDNVEVNDAYNGEALKVSNGSVIEEIDDQKLIDLDQDEAATLIKDLNHPSTDTKVRIQVIGSGIRELISTTLFLVFFSLLFALPIGLASAIYLVEYDVNPKVNSVIHFAIDSLAGIPSIIFGLFGALFFGQTLGLGQSLIAGILTITIMLLPIVIKSIEETLLSVPYSYREASYGLGATKTQTLFKVIIPSALPGILVAIILTMGRVIGESAIFIFVVGTSIAAPTLLGKGASLTVQIYSTSRENLDINYAASIALVIFVMIFVLNISAKLIARKIGGKK